MELRNYSEKLKECKTIDSALSILSDIKSSGLNKEDLKEFKEQISDFVKESKEEENNVCNRWIEEDKCKIHTCIKTFDISGSTFEIGNRYYIYIDDVSKMYQENLSKISDRLSDSVKDKINNIESIIYIISDNGIGTLKKRIKFPSKLKFKNYFKYGF